MTKAISSTFQNPNEQFEEGTIEHITGVLKALNELIDEQTC
jgi:hypothetical protein